MALGDLELLTIFQSSMICRYNTLIPPFPYTAFLNEYLPCTHLILESCFEDGEYSIHRLQFSVERSKVLGEGKNHHLGHSLRELQLCSLLDPSKDPAIMLHLTIDMAH
jgi:hypothetical protein